MEGKVISSASYSGIDSDLIENPGKVVIINFIGPVVKYSDWWMNMLGTQDYMRILDRYKNDPDYSGVVLNVDTGGGQLYGTPQFYDYVSEFKKTKPIGIYTDGLLCSGGYYFASPGSFIMANKRADAIGNIGMYSQKFDWEGYYASFGLKVHTIYSSLSPDKNKFHRDVISGVDKDYKNYIKNELDPECQKFIDDVKAARPQIKEEVFTGSDYNGIESLAVGLIDSNGTLQDAVNKVLELAKESNSKNDKKSKSKKSMSKNTKKFSALQAIIGIEGDGIPTVSTLSGKKGVEISEAQLSQINDALVEKDAALEKSKVTISRIRTATNAAIKTAGMEKDIEAGATTSAKITLLGAKVIEYGKRPKKEVSKPKSEGDFAEEEDDAVVKSTDAHNDLYKKA